MNLEDYSRFDVITIVSCTKRDDNRWEVIQKIKHRRLPIGSENWDEREASMSAIDFDLEKATALAMTSLVIYLDSIGGDLFEPTFVEEDNSDIPSIGLLQ